MARNGSRLMIKAEESSVNQSPRPAPTCSSRLRAMPSPDLFDARVRSMSCARTGATANIGMAQTKTNVSPRTRAMFASLDKLELFTEMRQAEAKHFRLQDSDC